ncbi:MAG: DUF72 domain-containing protein [Candidatus Aenigmatarchaeota archaeon]
MKSVKIGNCGWAYLNCKEYFGPLWQKDFKSKLQAYAKLFNLVEVNSTFYAIPKIATVQRWREEVDAINPNFEFTLKVSQLITHKNPFGKQAFVAFERMKEIAQALRANVLVFQSPSSFRPTENNIKVAQNFFNKIEREGFILAWEVRWAKEWTKDIVNSLFSELSINQVVDPFRQDIFYAKDIIYYRLHGFGRPSIYNYSFSKDELKRLAAKVKKQASKKTVYVLFNNADCYRNALEFANMF